MVNIEGLNKSLVLAVLYNASSPQGMGFMHYDKKPMTEQDADTYLKRDDPRSRVYFDYLKGRVMKLDLTSNVEFDEWGYDRDNGVGAAQRAVDSLRATLQTNAVEVQATHEITKHRRADEVMEHIHEHSTSGEEDGFGVVNIGLSDAADHLIPAIDRAVKPE